MVYKFELEVHSHCGVNTKQTATDYVHGHDKQDVDGAAANIFVGLFTRVLPPN